MNTITVAAIQCALPGPADANIAVVETHVREAARQGAKIILPPELFEGPYFCQTEELHWFETAKPTAEHPSVLAMQKLAKELQVYIPTSFFERDGQHYYNSLAMIDDARVTRKNSISAPVTPASRCGTRNTAASASVSAGTNGIRKPHAR